MRFAIGVITALIGTGCTHPGARGAPGPQPGVSDGTTAVGAGPIPVEVDNRSSYDVTIYAVRGSLRRRIGSAAGLSRTRVTVPTTFTADLGGFSVAAVRIGGRETYVSDLVSPQLGVRLRLMIQPRIVESALSIE